MTEKINIELEEWQVRTLRSYFKQNDKTQVAYWAFKVFDEALKQHCDIPIISSSYRWLKDCKYAWMQSSVGFPIKVKVISVNETEKTVRIKTEHQCGDVDIDKVYKTEMACPCR